MASRLRLAVPALLLVLAAFPVAGAAAGAESPYGSTASGDRWVTRFEYETSSGATSTTTATTTFSGVEDLVIGGETFAALRFDQVKTTRSTTNPDGLTTETTTTWRRAGDGALLRQSSEKTTQYPPYPTTTFSYVRTFKEPCAEWQWPLVVGAEWSIQCKFVMETAGKREQHDLTQTFRVTGTESVTLPAGTFDAWIVEKPTSQWTVAREWYAPAACGVVRSGSFYEGQLQFSYVDLQEFTCKAAQAAEETPEPPANETTQASPGLNDTTADANQTVPPPSSNETTSSPNETVPPSNETVPPSNETVPPSNQTDPPSSNEHASSPVSPTPQESAPEPAPEPPVRPAEPTPASPTAAPSPTPAAPSPPASPSLWQPPMPSQDEADELPPAVEADPGTVVAAKDARSDEDAGKPVPGIGAWVLGVGVGLGALARRRR